MVPRLLILATIAVVVLGLASSVAVAEEPQGSSSSMAIEQVEKTIVPLPTITQRPRLSTRERWRGAPYLRSTADETLRSHALDIALPSANSAFQGGVDLQQPRACVHEAFIRQVAGDLPVLGYLPYDPQVIEADLTGQAMYDVAPETVEAARGRWERLQPHSPGTD